MRLSDSLWRVGLPLAVVAGSALVLASAVRSRGRPARISLPAAGLAVLVWLMLAGDAAFGDQRPAFERQWKGATAVILALAGAVHVGRRFGRRGQGASQPAVAALGRGVPVMMPAFGAEVTEGMVSRWLKQVGDRVEAGEPLVRVSTDKVDVEIPAGASGGLREIRVPAGSSTAVGSTIAVIEPAAEPHGA